jgi:hypothetical protein
LQNVVRKRLFFHQVDEEPQHIRALGFFAVRLVPTMSKIGFFCVIISRLNIFFPALRLAGDTPPDALFA